jgi:NADPH-dependent 2,4-dienoyl-CoA reductase/sulfur reductase-like enzyme/rhodanese-related sulfurtransferase
MMPKPLKLVIVGGVAGGASTATRARRLSEDVEIVLFERGPYVSFANCGLPYHIGGTIPDRARLLVQTPEGLYARYEIDVRVNTEVLSIDRQAREVVAKDLRSGREYREAYDALVLSPGAEPIRPPIPGIDDRSVFTLRNMSDMDKVLRAVGAVADRTALIVGAGYVGLELTEAFCHRGLSVVLVEKLDHVMSVADREMVVPLHYELAGNGVDVRLGLSVTAFERLDDRLEAVLSDGQRVGCGLAVVAVGVRPETRLAKTARLELGSTGGILVDDRMRTSDSSIWAVGDAVEVRNFASDQPSLIPLAGPANRQGRIAADNILGRDSRYKATQGTAICKVFNLTFAMTGLTETMLKRTEQPYLRIFLHPADHAAYYPGAHPIALKLLFTPEDGKILGVQAVGRAGVDKRIDVFAVAMRAGLTVFDLEDLELCYAPPYGSAKDAVNMAGFVASNVLRGDADLWEPEELASAGEDQVLLDVRTFQEHARGSIPGALCAPLDELRERWEDLPREKELLVFCQVGLRGYVAVRFLRQRGFRARNLSGGFKRWQMWKGEETIPPVTEDEVALDG